MYPKRIAQLLVAALSVATAQAWLDPQRVPNHDKRQIGISLTLSVPDGDLTARTTTSSSPTAPPQTSTTTTPTASSSGGQGSSSTGRTTSAPSSSSTSAPPPITETRTTVITTTNSDGSPTSYTTATTATTTPGLSQDNSGTSSMPAQTRNIVIGVVVGVGGAIILAALALLAFRIWGRKKPVDDSDGLVGYAHGTSAYGGGGGSEKLEGSSPGGTMNSRTPFQSTLESYHAPTQVNPSANF